MFLRLLKNNIKQGIIIVHLPNGTIHRFGDQGLEAHWHIRDEKVLPRIARDGEFQLGQTYMEEAWDAGKDSLHNLLAVLRMNFHSKGKKRWFTPLLKLLRGYNNIGRSYADIAHHYDTDEPIFRMFLDQEMYYSCAFFQTDDDTLEQAQFNKAETISRKLLLQPGHRVLDIGCGWGSLAFHLAQRHQADVRGITLSKEQLRVAQREGERRNLAQVRFELADYREHQGEYDRIVSVGMLEHVGEDNLPIYFEQVRDMLKEDGVALIHTIGNRLAPKETNPWIDRYIFPGGRIPALSELSAAIEKCGLMVTDLEVWRQHYSWTLRQWHQRFQQHREAVRKLKGEAFCRMWEFYLTAADISFEYVNLVVFQFQLAKEHGIVPVRRHYLYS